MIMKKGTTTRLVCENGLELEGFGFQIHSNHSFKKMSYEPIFLGHLFYGILF